MDPKSPLNPPNTTPNLPSNPNPSLPPSPPNEPTANPPTQTVPKYPPFTPSNTTQSPTNTGQPVPTNQPQAASPPSPNQPQYNTQQDTHVIQGADTPPPKKSKKGLLLLLILTFLVLAFAGSAAFAWGVAYGSIKMDNYPKVEVAIKNAVYSLPFTQKPPEFLLAKTIMAHQDVTRESFDVSVAVGSDELSDPLGITQLDFQIKGNVDYTDPKNVFFNTEIFLTKGLNIELKKNGDMVYFNIKDIPSFLLAFAGMSKSQFEPVLNKWVSWDVSPLDTEARRTIQDTEVDYLDPVFAEEKFNEYLDDYLLEKLVVTDDEVDGHKVYKIALNADSEVIDYLQRKLENSSSQGGSYSVLGYTADSEKLSDYVKTLTVEIYIDKRSYYTRKLIFSSSLEYDSSELSDLGLTGSGSSMADFAFAAKFDNFGEEVVVNEPMVDMTSEEFIEKISVIVAEIYGNMMGVPEGGLNETQALARDARRKADLEHIRAALELYRADCKKYPARVNELLVGCPESANEYLKIIPEDPLSTPYYYQSNGSEYFLCANFDTPPVNPLSSCPDPSYNYHISRGDL